MNFNVDDKRKEIYNKEEFKEYVEIRKKKYYKNKEWLLKKAEEGYFTYFMNPSKEELLNFIEQIEDFKKVLNSVHKDNWDFDTEPFIKHGLVVHRLIILIRYPKITIKNSKNNKHIIEDLFVVLQIITLSKHISVNHGRVNIYGLAELEGFRAKLNRAECNEYYTHSHLKMDVASEKGNILIAKTFCTGIIKGSVKGLIMDTHNYKTDLLKFEMLLLTINSFVEWESLEGGPYKYIKNLTTAPSPIKGGLCSRDYLHIQYIKIVDEIKDLKNIDFIVRDNKYKIVKNSNFEKLIKPLVIKYCSKYYSDMLMKIDDRNRQSYYSPIGRLKSKIEENLENLLVTPYFYFNGNKIEVEIKTLDNIIDINNYNINPKFLKYAAQKIEEELYYKSVRACTT